MLDFRCIAEFKVACTRLQSILELPEYQHPGLDFELAKGSVELVNANCYWISPQVASSPPAAATDASDAEDAHQDREENGKVEDENVVGKVTKKKVPPGKIVQALYEVNLRIEPGQLVGVAGPIGSGKSSLMNAILGEVS